jgi:hypothetical protein
MERQGSGRRSGRRWSGRRSIVLIGYLEAVLAEFAEVGTSGHDTRWRQRHLHVVLGGEETVGWLNDGLVLQVECAFANVGGDKSCHHLLRIPPNRRDTIEHIGHFGWS